MTRQKRARILRLEEFGLDDDGLAKLGARPVMLQIDLRQPSLEPLIPLPPKERLARIGELLHKRMLRLQRRWPDAGIVKAFQDNPYSLRGRVRADEVERIGTEPGVKFVWIEKVEGRRRRKSGRRLTYYCVRGKVAIQIEGRTRGLVETEDRFVLVKATSEADAKRRLAREWEQYAEPYLDTEGRLVRWQLVEIVDVYDTCDDEIDPRGAEVYSELRQERMKPAYLYPPR